MPANTSLIKRLFTHLRTTQADVRRLFPENELDRIEAAVQSGEGGHHGELRIVIEASLPLSQVWDRVSPRERAQHVFRELDIWDTEANSGVLIYVNLADHAVEIVADRGFTAKVPASTWQQLCAAITTGFAQSNHVTALHGTIEALHQLARQHFPAPAGSHATRGNVNELPDRPLIR